MSIISQACHSLLSQYPTQTILVAYSGGVDSQVLLNALVQAEKSLSKSATRIKVCHVHHGLSQYADDWLAFAKKQCQSLQVPITTKQVELDTNTSESVEALARDARYQVLKELTCENTIVVTAHHQDDQIETMLLALKRGAGVSGLSCIVEKQPFSKGFLVRPLLSISREAIEQYAELEELQWIEDDSNSDQSFDRNFLRHSIIPLLKERWPSYGQTVSRSALLCEQADSQLKEIAEQDYLSCSVIDDSLSVEHLLLLSVPRFNGVIRYWLGLKEKKMPSVQQLAQLREQLAVEGDRQPEVMMSGVVFRRFKGRLYLTPDYLDVSNWQQSYIVNEIKNELAVTLPGELSQVTFIKALKEGMFSIPTETKHLTLTCQRPSVTCQPEYRNHSRPIKKVLQELDIPPWQRKRLVYLFADEHLVGVIGHFICKPFSAHQHPVKFSIC